MDPTRLDYLGCLYRAETIQLPVLCPSERETLRRRFNAELAEVNRLLSVRHNTSSGIALNAELPHQRLLDCIVLWCSWMDESLRQRDVDLLQLQKKGIEALKEILSDPLNPDLSLPLLAEQIKAAPGIPALVLLLFQKLSSQQSLFYCDSFAQLPIPPDPQLPPSPTPLPRQPIFDEDSMQAELDALERTLEGRLQQQNQKLEAIEQKDMAGFDQLDCELNEVRRMNREEYNRLLSASERLHRRLDVLVAEKNELKRELDEARRSLDEARVQTAQLNLACNQLQQAIEEKKDQWIKQVIQLGICIGLSWLGSTLLQEALRTGILAVENTAGRTMVSLTTRF